MISRQCLITFVQSITKSFEIMYWHQQDIVKNKPFRSHRMKIFIIRATLPSGEQRTSVSSRSTSKYLICITRASIIAARTRVQEATRRAARQARAWISTRRRELVRKILSWNSHSRQEQHDIVVSHQIGAKIIKVIIMHAQSSFRRVHARRKISGFTWMGEQSRRLRRFNATRKISRKRWKVKTSVTPTRRDVLEIRRRRRNPLREYHLASE